MTAALTVDSIRTILGREVEDVVLTAAKASAMGLDPETIANSIGVEKAEVDELMQGQDYKDVRLLVGAEMLKDRTDRDSNWDGIESSAVKKLARRLEFENDTDTILKIAAVANRATRRTAPPKEAGPLDPSQAGARIPLTLTKRYTEKLGVDGTIERSEIQQISVLNGSAINPKFEDVKGLLSGNNESQPAEGRHKEMVSRTNVSTSQEYIDRIGANEKPFSMQELMMAAKRVKRSD
jgi:hypothetical protein